MERKFKDRWVFQKNISSEKQIVLFLKSIKENNNVLNKKYLKYDLKEKNIYKGRSENGSENTIGIRLSQMFFYMFGYKKNNSNFFIPTQTTWNILNKKNEDENFIRKNMLVNLFSIQFPAPYSKVNEHFSIFVGRLIIKLMLNDSLEYKIFIDEFIWFLPFIKKINKITYEKLVNDILDFRKLPFEKKLEKFKQIKDYNHLFANCLHESKYFFLKIFSQFGVINLKGDKYHNSGNFFKFKHGSTNTYRNNKIDSYSGYIELNKNLKEISHELLSKYSLFNEPISPKNTFGLEDFKLKLYENELLKYLAIVFPEYNEKIEIISLINNMTEKSKYGSLDGKEFENSLKPIFKLFREEISTEIISGSGDTDLIFIFRDFNDQVNKINIEAKSRKSYNNLQSTRIQRHIEKNNSKYCLVISPKFSNSNFLDIEKYKIVTLTSNILAQYCSKECLSNKDKLASFSDINKIALKNLGSDISDFLEEIIENKYGYKKIL
ncbi:AlwI restriction endonuclease [Candidatus Hepatoplasma crinochetorum Av]|uniref:AlwI restriction endonuclease n=1 Tax=Candidatus Hepatoplasma crinochetorum Av TaxID=1427984 RepID=W8GK71_9MOLU|nr:hypothetical protein [Candidatus Hepatoplasma crinochetorum]AHK22647.1 AlwI restriction endonuclease [Candidatus Hepatoplasma crinochetorum Av]